MIYTCTLNPSLDYFIELEQVELGEVNLIKKDKKMPGGKGINVSRVLKRLGYHSSALGFIGGFTGRYVKESLMNEGIDTNFLEIDGDTRINIKAKSDVETQYNGQSPAITSEQLQLLLEKLSDLKDGDILVLSGSVPSSLPSSIYRDIMDVLKSKQVKCIVDTTNEALKQTFAMKPFLIKPNHKELGELFNVTITSPDQAVPYARKLIDAGVEQVIVSMAEMGALYVSKSETLIADVPNGVLKNSVGAGDSLVGGFIASFVTTGNYIEAFRYGVASGSATAFSVDLCTAQEVTRLLDKVHIREISTDLGV